MLGLDPSPYLRPVTRLPHPIRGMTVAILLSATMLAGCLDSPPELHGDELNHPVEASDFTLLDQNGNNFTLSDLTGKVVVVTFIYTNCPDICPAIEQNLKAAKGMLGDKYDQEVVFVSITIDPERDDVERLNTYSNQNGYTWPHLTSDKESLRGVWDSWGIYVKSDIDCHTDGTGMVHKVGILYPDGTSSIVQGLYGMDMEATNTLAHTNHTLTEAGITHVWADENLTHINGVESIWALHLWNKTAGAWESEPTDLSPREVVLMRDTNHIAWVAEGSHISQLPSAEDNMTEEVVPEDYYVSHMGLTFILDKHQKKQVIWWGTDWDVNQFVEDLETVMLY